MHNLFYVSWVKLCNINDGKVFNEKINFGNFKLIEENILLEIDNKPVFTISIKNNNISNTVFNKPLKGWF